MSSFSNQSQQAQDASSSAGQTNTNLPAFSDQAENFAFAFMPPTSIPMTPTHATPNDYATFQSGLAAPTAGAPHAQQYPPPFPYPPVHQPALGPVGPSASDGWVVANIAGFTGLYQARILPRLVSQSGVIVTNEAPDWYRQEVPAVPSAYRASAPPPIPAPQQAILPSLSAGPSDLKRQRSSELQAPKPPRKRAKKAKADVDVKLPYRVQLMDITVDVQPQPEPGAVAAQVPVAAPFTPSASSSSFTHNPPPQTPVYPGPTTQRPVPRRVGAPRRATGTAQVPVAQELPASSSSGQIAHSASAAQPVAVAAVQQRPAQVPAAQGLPASTSSAPNAGASTESDTGSTAATLYNITNAVPPSPPRAIPSVGSLSSLRASSSSSGNRDQNLPEQGTTSLGVPVADAVDGVQKAEAPQASKAEKELFEQLLAACGATQGDAQMPVQTDKAEESQVSKAEKEVFEELFNADDYAEL